MKYRGREIDPLALWENYVEFPTGMKVKPGDEFTDLVVCPNPDHHTTKRHFQINLKRPLVHCFAHCGISGNYERAIEIIEGVGPREARRRILRHSRLGKVEVSRRAGRTVDVVSEVDLSDFSYLPPIALEYLATRGIRSSSVGAFSLGWDKDERRITIPAFDFEGRLRFVIKRAVRDKDVPKYLYPEGSQRDRVLFGAGQIDLGMVRSFGVVLVEGSLDTVLNHQHDLSTTVGILGSKLSEFQAQLIANMRPRRIYTMFDKDASGVAATISVHDLLPNIPIFVCRYPKHLSDPGQFRSREEAARSINRALPWMKFAALPAVSQLRASRSRSSRRISQVG